MSASPGRLAFALDHAGTSVGDLDRSIAFYTDVFGFDVVERFAIPATAVRGAVLVNPGGARVELFHRDDSDPITIVDPIEATQRQGWFQLAFAVHDVRSVYEQVVAAGAAPVKPPFVAPDGATIVAFVSDPDGNLLELISRTG